MPATKRVTFATKYDVHSRAREIVAKCEDEELKEELARRDNYSSPSVFWGYALDRGIVSQDEYDAAYRALGSYSWAFVGD